MDPQPVRPRVPLHRRAIDIEAFETDDPDCIELVGSYLDERPRAAPPQQHVVHRMTLTIQVRVSDMVIIDASAVMHDFPHIECPDIAPSFSGLVGLSIARGFNKEVQRRFIGIGGCAHLEFLARAMGPAAVQAVSSARARARIANGFTGSVQVNTYMRNTCHVWADDGPAIAKIDAGWTPGLAPTPTPNVVEIRRLVAERRSRDA